jgi:hypothetical protein
MHMHTSQDLTSVYNIQSVRCIMSIGICLIEQGFPIGIAYTTMLP